MMIELPDFTKAFQHENDFYLSSDVSRIGKLLAHCELYRMTVDLPGPLIECGVFKGASFVRWASFRHLFGGAHTKRILGFDAFGRFPTTNFPDDKRVRARFVEEAGDQSISVAQLREVLSHKGLDKNIELVEGNIVRTLPSYVEEHPELVTSLVNLDTDIYEPAVTILDTLWSRLVPGGVLIIDDYGVFPGETQAVDEFFAGKQVRFQKFSFSATPTYIVK
jgi:Macrocin-O-methyltransferase (TylF)